MKKKSVLEEALWMILIIIFYYGKVPWEIINLFVIVCSLNDIRYEFYKYGTFLIIVGYILFFVGISSDYDLTLDMLFINSSIRFFEYAIVCPHFFVDYEILAILIETLLSMYIFKIFFGLKSIPIIFFGECVRNIFHTKDIEKRKFLKKILPTYYSLFIYELSLGCIYLFQN